MFQDTPYAKSWWIFHDHLSAWWSKEAQDHLAALGFRDRQVRAWGETNAQFSCDHESLVGNRPEMCPLDFHLFEAAEELKNIIMTSSKPMGPADDPCRHGRYGMGTPTDLSRALFTEPATAVPRTKRKGKRAFGSSQVLQ